MTGIVPTCEMRHEDDLPAARQSMMVMQHSLLRSAAADKLRFERSSGESARVDIMVDKEIESTPTCASNDEGDPQVERQSMMMLNQEVSK